jgi:hypothetical protein
LSINSIRIYSRKRSSENTRLERLTTEPSPKADGNGKIGEIPVKGSTMSGAKVQALRIFAPPEQPYGNENWVEQILGSIIRPIHDEFETHIHWMWVNRYTASVEILDSQIKTLIPDHFLRDNWYRYVLFRLSIENPIQDTLHKRVMEHVQSTRCFASPWEDYDIVSHLGSNRYIETNAPEKHRVKRAQLIASFMDATLKLMLDTLVFREGQWRFEHNADSQQNPYGSIFESVHHLFCNATEVPVDVLVSTDRQNQENRLIVTTRWMYPDYTSHNLDQLPDYSDGLFDPVRIHY